MKGRISIILIHLLISTFARSQAFESFNFSGSLNTNGWTKHSGTISGEFQTIETSSDYGNNLYYSNLPLPDGNRALFVSTNKEDVNKPVSGISDIGYLSFLLKVNSTSGLNASGDYFTGFGASTGTTVTTFAPRIFIKSGATAGTYQLGIQNSSGGTPNPSYDPTEYPIGTTVFVVVKLNTVTSPIEASLFINPAPGSDEPPATVSNNSGTIGFTTFASVFLRQGMYTGDMEIDEIRVGSTWNDVASDCSTRVVDVQTSCDSITWHGMTYYENNDTATYVTLNSAGCDSIVKLNLTINYSSNGFELIEVCSFPYLDPNTGITYNTPDTIVNITTSSNGCPARDSIIVSLVSNSFETIINPDPDLPILFTDSIFQEGFQWYDCNSNQILSGATGDTLILTENGSYALITDWPYNCLDTSDCISVFWMGGLDEKYTSEFSVQPNPSNGNFELNLESIETPVLVEILGLNGQMVYSKETSEESCLISLPDLSKGIYILSIRNSESVYIKRILIE